MLPDSGDAEDGSEQVAQERGRQRILALFTGDIETGSKPWRIHYFPGDSNLIFGQILHENKENWPRAHVATKSCNRVSCKL